jgi:hypothetical protein
MGNNMDFVSVMLFLTMGMAIFGCTMMCRDLLVREVPRERLGIFVFVIAGSAVILLIDAQPGYGWMTVGWIIWMIILGWFGHRFVGTPFRKE